MRVALQLNNGPDTQKVSDPFVRSLEYTLLTATNLSDGGRVGRADHGYPVPHYNYHYSCFVIRERLVEPGNNRCNTRDGLHEE